MNSASDIPVDDQEFLDWAFDCALQRIEDGQRVVVDELLHGRDALREDVIKAIRLAEEVARGIGSAATSAAPPPNIRGYAILRELGSGGMGCVYLARQERLGGRAIALKVLPAGIGLSARARQRFQNEANAIARLRHPHIVAVHDVIHADSVHAFAMEWVDGASLQSIIDALTKAEGRDAGPAMPPQVDRSQPGHAGTGRMANVAATLGAPEVSPAVAGTLGSTAYEVFIARLGVAMARALGEVHRAGLLHRDIKPSNILLRRDGTPLLSDFGLVRDVDATVTQVGHFAGTPAYASPEQLRGEVESLDARSDVFSLGATLYHALSLHRPFAGGDNAAILQQIEGGGAASLRSLNNRVPRDLETVIAKAMDADAAHRYATADELADDLERLLNLQPIRAKPAGMITRSVKSLRRNRRAVAAACLGGVAALALCIALVIWFFAFPRWSKAHLDEARLALLDPEQANAVFAVTFFGGESSERPTVSPAVAERALAEYAAAIRFAPFDAGIRRERDIVHLASVISANTGKPVQDQSPTGTMIGDLGTALPLTSSYALDQGLRFERSQLQAASADDLRSLGLLASLTVDPHTALEAWNALDLKRDPDPLVEATLGVLYLATSEPARAYPRLRNAVEAFPNVGFLTVYLADAALQCGDLEKAQQWLDASQSMPHQDRFDGRTRVQGDLFAAMGDFDRALEMYNAVPGANDVLRYHRAKALDAADRFDDALVEYMSVTGGAGDRHEVKRAFVACADRWWDGLDVPERAMRMVQAMNLPSESATSLVQLLRVYAMSIESLTSESPGMAIPGLSRGTIFANPRDSAPPHDADASAFLQKVSLWNLTETMEVRNMKLWNSIVRYPRLGKIMQSMAWLSRKPLAATRGVNRLMATVASLTATALPATSAEAQTCGTAPCFQGLGDLPGGAFNSLPYALSDDGTTVVGSSVDSSGTNSFRWRADTGMVALGDLAGGNFFSRAEGVSADGSVVAGSSSSTNSGGGVEAYRWTSATGLVALGDLPGGDFYSTTRAISDDGMVVVGWCNFGAARPFRWTAATGMQQFPIPSGEQGIAFATTQDGAITFGDAGPVNTNTRLIRWDTPTTFTDLGQLLGPGSEMNPYRVSNNGQHVVGYACASSCTPFEWTAALGSVSLGDLPGGSTDGRALGITGNGEFVVGYSSSAIGPEAVIWDQTRTMSRLVDVLAQNAVAIPSGWILREAVGVAVVGNQVVVCGNGTNPAGHPEAWIARYSIAPPSPAGLSLIPTGSCYHQGDQVVVHVDAAGLALAATGGQFFLDFDHSKLAFVSAAPGGVGNPANPFDLEVYECLGQTLGGVCVPLPGKFDYAVGVVGGGPGSGTMADSTMAVLTFTALADVCNVGDLVQFRDNVSGPLLPPTRLADEFGTPIILPLTDLGSIVIDSVAPIITCPSNVSVNADAGMCSATLTIPTASAIDSCDASPTVVGTRSDAQPLNAPYPGGATTSITWTATDDCGNVSTCNQTVTVSSFNEMLVSVQLQPNISPVGTLTRCIRFELLNCTPAIGPVIVDAPIAFNVVGGSPNVASVDTMVLVPCGQYSCATARDRKHTLRRTDENFHIVGTQYVADFTGDPASGGDWLIGGNLNDDPYIDILDFGIFVGQYGMNYGSGNTACGLIASNADVSGDGIVGPGDFTFIQINFLTFHEADCCSMLLRMVGPDSGDGVGPGPTTRISVRELIRRGMKDATAGDVNRDGWVDQSDIAAYLQGG